MEGLYFKTLCPSSSVVDAAVGFVTGAQQRQLLVAKMNSLQVWQWFSEEASGDPADGQLRLVEEAVVHERIEHIRILGNLGQKDAGCGPDVAVVLVLTSDHVAQLLQWDRRRGKFRSLSQAQAKAPLPCPEDPPAMPRSAGSILSEQHTVLRNGKAERIFAAALYEGFLHVISIASPEGGSAGGEGICVRVQHMPCRNVPGAPKGVRKTEDVASFLSLAFLPLRDGTDQCGYPLLAVLHENTGYMDRAVHLQCFAVDLQNEALLEGPWTVRNIHPTTTLVKTKHPCAPGEEGGVVAISSRGCQLYTLAEPGGCASVEMKGLPKSAEEVWPGVWLVGDTTGELWYMVLAGDTWQGKLVAVEKREAPGHASAGAAVSVAEVLRCIPISPEGAGHLLFLGSHQGHSQLLRAPRLRAYDTPARTALGALASSWEMLDAAAVENLAPISDAMVFEHPPGSGEQHLAMCCGGAPMGRLAVTSMAAGRTVLAETGGLFEAGAPELHSAQLQTTAGVRQTYLALSFDAPENTTVMSLQEGCLSPCCLPGFDTSSSTLLFSGVPGGWAVQVTPSEVLVIAGPPDFSKRSSWRTPARATSACLRDSRLVVVTGSALHALVVEEDSGTAVHVQSADWPQQISAVAQVLLQLPGRRPMRGVAVGTWQDNRVAICRGESPATPVAAAELPHGQARSIVVTKLGGSEAMLLVGTSAGLVAIYNIKAKQGTGDAGEDLELILSSVAWAGSSPVHLTTLWHPETAEEMLYAQSSQDLLLQSSKGPQGSRVCVLRVHGGGQTASLAPLPDGDSVFAMVWADCQGRLLVGQLEPEAALRERSCYLEDTPVAAAYHKGSRCCVVMCASQDQRTTIRLVHVDSLQQVSLMRLEQNHRPCAVISTTLPCTSVNKAKADAFPARLQLEKEFIVMSTFLMERDESDLQVAHGLLSVFEVIRNPTSSSHRYEIVLHGVQPVSGTPHCLGGIRLPPTGDAGGNSAAEDEPAVLLGSTDSLILLRVFVDDLATWGVDAVEKVLSLLEVASTPAAVDVGSLQNEAASIPIGGEAGRTPGAEAEPCGPGSPVMAPDPPEGRWEIWRQRMRIETLSTVGTHSGGCVTSLSTAGSTAMAHEFLGPVAIYKVGVTGATSLTRVAIDASPVFSPSGCWLTNKLCVVSVQPYGFYLLGRDSAAQDQYEAAVRLHHEKVKEAGKRGPRARQNAAQNPPDQALQDTRPDEQAEAAHDVGEAPVMQAMGLCRKPQLVVKFCSGQLGIPLGPPSAPAGQGHAISSAVYVTACGMVGSIQLLAKDDMAALERLQAAIHMASISNGGEGAPWAATVHQHADMWNWSLSEMLAAGQAVDEDHVDEGDSLPAACVDGDLFKLFLSKSDGTFCERARQIYEDSLALGADRDSASSWEDAIALCKLLSFPY